MVTPTAQEIQWRRFCTQCHVSHFMENVMFSGLYNDLYGVVLRRLGPSSAAKRCREQISHHKSGLFQSILKNWVGLNHEMTLGA